MTNLFLATEKALAIIRWQNGIWDMDLQLVEKQPVCLALDPLHQEQIYCGTNGQGLWQSSNGGTTWEPTGKGIISPHVTAVAVSQLDQVTNAGIVYAGTEPSAIYRSEDRGASWQDLPSLRALPSAVTWSFPPRPWTSHIRWITLDPLVSGRIFAAAEAGALVRSLDGGQTWEDRKPGGPFDTHTLIMHRLAPDRLYSAAGDGFMQPGNGFVRSDDGGEHWYRPNDGLNDHYLWSVAADPADPDTLIISAAPGPRQAHAHVAEEAASTLYRRTGSGQWQHITEGLPPAQGLLASVLATDEAEPGVFYVASNKGIFRSIDAGILWEELPVPGLADMQLGRAHALVVSHLH
jgi:photosystem II stability/assembly factor-like uncharacterized protein